MAYNFVSGTTDRITTGVTQTFPVDGSLMFRFRPNMADSTTAAHIFFETYTDSTHLFHIGQGGGNNNWFAGWYNAGELRVVAAASGTWTQNAWNTLILTWSQSGDTYTNFYTNNVLRGSLAGLSSLHTTTGNWEIGSIARDTSYTADSRIAQVAVFRQVVPATVRAMYERGYSPEYFRTFGGLRYWPLDKESGISDVWGRNSRGTPINRRTLAEDPRVITLPKRRRWDVDFDAAAAAGGVGPLIGGRLLHGSLIHGGRLAA